MAYLVEINAMCLNLLCFLCSPKHKILRPERSGSDTKYGLLYNDVEFRPQALEIPAFGAEYQLNATEMLAND